MKVYPISWVMIDTRNLKLIDRQVRLLIQFGQFPFKVTAAVLIFNLLCYSSIAIRII